MAFLNFSLLFGALLAIIPVVLHLVMRQRPRRVIFPSVQLLLQRRELNRRRLQIRQWFLLALRCATIGVLALAFARPSVPAGAAGSFFAAGCLLVLLLTASLALVLSVVQRRSRWWIGGLTLLSCLLLVGTITAWDMASRSRVREPVTSRHLPVAAALVIDTSASMDYQFENQTRLAQAQRYAERLMREFPAESQIAIVETRPFPATFAVDLAAAQRALARLKTSGVSEPWSDTLSRVIGLLASSNLVRREIYLFTDLTRSSFNSSRQTLRSELEQSTEIALYVIDVGVNQPNNIALGELSVSQESLTVGGTLQLETDVRAVGSSGARAVEVWLETPDPERPVVVNGELLLPAEVRRDSQPVVLSTNPPENNRSSSRDATRTNDDTSRTDVTGQRVSPADSNQEITGTSTNRSSTRGTEVADSSERDQRLHQPRDTSVGQRIRFSLGGLSSGLYHGRVKLTGTDSFPSDDQRYFSFEVRSARPVLVVAPPDVYAPFLTEAIAPFELRELGASSFTSELIEPSALPQQTLTRFSTVALLDPLPLTTAQWEQLANYVQAGGSLAIFLGHHATASGTFASSTAQQLLGGKLDRIWRTSGRELFLAPQAYDHPILAPFREQATSVPWNLSPVQRHWGFIDLQAQTRVVMRYTNGQPALLDVTYGRGQVLTLTTPISDPLQPPGWTAWNELPTSEVSWPYFVLVNEMFRYLAGEGRRRLNYRTGEIASLRNEPDRLPSRYELFAPAEPPLDVTASEGEMVIRSTERPGHYRLRGFRETAVQRGFSVNLPSQESDLTRIQLADLDELLGTGRYQFAQNEEEMESEVDESRLGREFYPYLLVLLTLVCGLELLFANRFYASAST